MSPMRSPSRSHAPTLPWRLAYKWNRTRRLLSPLRYSKSTMRTGDPGCVGCVAFILVVGVSLALALGVAEVAFPQNALAHVIAAVVGLTVGIFVYLRFV